MGLAVLKIIGNHISPFVRKVLAVCEIKCLPYEVDSIVPFFGNESFGELSPLRRIPVLVDGATVVNDSSGRQMAERTGAARRTRHARGGSLPRRICRHTPR